MADPYLTVLKAKLPEFCYVVIHGPSPHVTIGYVSFGVDGFKSCAVQGFKKEGQMSLWQTMKSSHILRFCRSDWIEVEAGFLRRMAVLEMAKRKADNAGELALQRLVLIASGDTGQSYKLRSFLLGCYDGAAFRFDLSELRGLDHELFQDCMAVLAMDYFGSRAIHKRVGGHSEIFRIWAEQVTLSDERDKTEEGP